MRNELGAGCGGRTNNPCVFRLANLIRSEIGGEIKSHKKFCLWINLLELGFVLQCLIRRGDGRCKIWLRQLTSGHWDGEISGWNLTITYARWKPPFLT